MRRTGHVLGPSALVLTRECGFEGEVANSVDPGARLLDSSPGLATALCDLEQITLLCGPLISPFQNRDSSNSYPTEEL